MSEALDKGMTAGKLPISLSMDDPEPMYRQIEVQLRDLILSGTLPSGTKLPSVRALAKDLSVSVITTRRAYQDLEGSGFIQTRQGMGTSVARIETAEKERYRQEVVLGAFEETARAGLRAGYDAKDLRTLAEEAISRVEEDGSSSE